MEMSIKLSRWDTAEYLKTEQDIQAYLEAVLEEGGDDPAFILHALGVIARAKNMSQLAREAGLSREGLYKALSNQGNPTLSTVTKIAKALGLQIKLETAAQA
jgi:probable addiction module antidote protein